MDSPAMMTVLAGHQTPVSRHWGGLFRFSRPLSGSQRVLQLRETSLHFCDALAKLIENLVFPGDNFDLYGQQSTINTELQALYNADLASDIHACAEIFGAFGSKVLTGSRSTLSWSRH